MMEKWEYCVPQNMNFYVTLTIFPNVEVAETPTYFAHDVPQKTPKLRNGTNPAWVARDTFLERDGQKRRMKQPLTGLRAAKITYLEREKRTKTEAIYLELVEQIITRQKHVCYR